MAKIHEEIVVIKLSKLVRESDAGTEIATDDIVLPCNQLLKNWLAPALL
jgi:hypothetical protein